MKKILLSLLFLAGSTYALEVQKAEIKFTAFKTYAKKGVSGVFDKVALQTKQADNVTLLLTDATAKIDTASVNSGNKARDAKLVSKFFEVQGVDSIDAKIVNVGKTSLLVAISMHGKTLKVPMNYSVQNNTIHAKGTIDLADFTMLPSLHSINKACYALHQGKTWQDVDIYFTIQYK